MANVDTFSELGVEVCGFHVVHCGVVSMNYPWAVTRFRAYEEHYWWCRCIWPPLQVKCILPPPWIGRWGPVFDAQDMGAPLRVITIPVVGFWSRESPANQASTQKSNKLSVGVFAAQMDRIFPHGLYCGGVWSWLWVKPNWIGSDFVRLEKSASCVCEVGTCWVDQVSKIAHNSLILLDCVCNVIIVFVGGVKDFFPGTMLIEAWLVPVPCWYWKFWWAKVVVVQMEFFRL